MPRQFFEEALDQSEVKSQIVADYFGAWTTIMASKSRSEKLAYIDLFSGPGRYSNGTKSTPLKVVEQIIAHPILKEKMVVLFNDADSEFANNLHTQLIQLPGIDNLRHKPQVFNSVVGDEMAEQLEKTSLVPSLGFIDPWGYKGLSSRLIAALIKDWGSDCIFFFNYNRINMGLTNPVVVEHMNSIFGEKRADWLRGKVRKMLPEEREQTILNELAEKLSNNRKNYVLPFRFIRAGGERTSHYLILVSKHVLGYTIMKNIMYRYSSEHNDGVASFSYIPVSNRQLSLLSLYDRPVDNLADDLCHCFAGKSLNVQQIHDLHHINTPFVMANYKEALRRLELNQRVTCDPCKRRVINGIKSMADHVIISFPQ
ncbi:three-Cys-motif partner protein TcmP [Sporomusa sp. GT1]|uniref:three-Cys-motif partner protein TcmP n=1 Tax=Sporomusa sp. GT1 TaxID=1534747 RepID=UPI001CB7F702|nr:three-Cys-motif partner protein TcmP [Sporomusa sp. GT1]